MSQIEITRDTVHSADDAGIHGPEEARIFREAVEKGFPGARFLGESVIKNREKGIFQNKPSSVKPSSRNHPRDH